MNKVLYTFLIILIGVTFIGSGVRAMASASPSDYKGYNGEIDIVTGLPKEIADNTDTGVTGVVALQDGVAYDGNAGLYMYPIPGGTFNCSVADGMIVTGSVAMSITGDNENIEVYRDGNKYDDLPESVEDVGNYSIVTWSDSSEQQIMTFQIVSAVTGMVKKYIMPNGFNVKSVYINGEEVRTGKGSVDMTKEGNYEINYRCSGNRVGYTLSVVVDHTPPSVTFDGLDSNNRADGPVTVSGMADTDVIKIIKNGDDQTEIKLNLKHQIVNPGSYTVTVYDAAGNSTVKKFKIRVYFNLKAWIFMVILVLVLIGLCVALLISKKTLRVR